MDRRALYEELAEKAADLGKASLVMIRTESETMDFYKLMESIAGVLYTLMKLGFMKHKDEIIHIVRELKWNSDHTTIRG